MTPLSIEVGKKVKHAFCCRGAAAFLIELSTPETSRAAHSWRVAWLRAGLHLAAAATSSMPLCVGTHCPISSPDEQLPLPFYRLCRTLAVRLGRPLPFE